MGFTLGTFRAAGATGWSVFSNPSRIVYVDNTRPDDSGDGFSHATAKKTLTGVSGGLSLLRDGFADWLLLKMGGTWTEVFHIDLNGASLTDRMLWSSYDPAFPGEFDPIGSSLARPIIKPNTSQGNAIELGIGGNYLGIVGLDLYCHDRDPASGTYSPSTVDSAVAGIWGTVGLDGLLIEDCLVRYFNYNVSIQGQSGGSVTNFVFRRNVIIDAYGVNDSITNYQSQGAFLYNCDYPLIEENIFDHNGWNTADLNYSAMIFNHNLYVQYTNTYPTIRGNVFARDASGCQFRAGGVVDDNFFVGSPYSHTFGAPIAGTNYCQNNVYLEGIRTIEHFTSQVIGTGDGPQTMQSLYNGSIPMNVGSIVFDKLIVANQVDTSFGFAIAVETGFDGKFTVSNSIMFSWRHPIQNEGSTITDTNNVKDEAGANNITVPPQPFSHPTRVSADYAASISVGSSLDDLCTAWRTVSKRNWPTNLTANAVNNYFRGNFDQPLIGANDNHITTRYVHEMRSV